MDFGQKMSCLKSIRSYNTGGEERHGSRDSFARYLYKKSNAIANNL